jgi:hypothetical protein
MLILAACAGSSSGPDPTLSEGLVDSGSWYVRAEWPHDGNPFESTNFVVYSDAASIEARHEVATVAEAVWAELLDELAIEPSMLLYPEGQDKVDIYAYHDYDPQDWGGWAYYGGLLVWSPDHPDRQSGNNRLPPVVKHELVHVIQWLITGGQSRPVDTWFIEGLPLALASDARFSIRGLDQLNRLTAEYGTISPIAVKSYSQITSPDAGEHFYYPMFQLAVEYLMDDEGNGGSPPDMRDVLVDVAEGTSFEAAFEDRTSLRFDDFENEFFGLMDAYLPRYRNRVFAPVGFAVVSALVIAFVISALVLGHRPWRPAAAVDGARAAPGRLARIGFYGEIVIASGGVIALFLSVLFAVGTEDALYNAAYTPYRIFAYAILVSYLAGSTALLLWAVHQWSRHSRSAFLLAPLIIAASAATITAFIIGSALI